MKIKKYQQERKHSQAEKKLEKQHYAVIVGLMAFAVVYHYFVEPTTIGNDSRYSIFVFWLPTLTGMLILGFYRRHFLLNRFKTHKGLVWWAFMTVFYSVQGILFSYLSFGQLAKVSWDIINYQVAQQRLEETIQCEVTRFWSKRRPSVDFMVEGNYESFPISYQELKVYETEAVADYLVNLKAQKGIWNYYIVNEWSIVKK